MVEDDKGVYMMHQSHKKKVNDISCSHYKEITQYREIIEDLKQQFRKIFEISRKEMGLDIDYTKITTKSKEL